jgi:hypothetical protein
MTFGLSDRNARENARALKSRIAKGKKAADALKLAARAFAMSAIREIFRSERPMTAICIEFVATWESAYTIPCANEPEPTMTTSAVFTRVNLSTSRPSGSSENQWVQLYYPPLDSDAVRAGPLGNIVGLPKIDC